MEISLKLNYRYWSILLILLLFSTSAPVTEAMGSVSRLRYFTVVNEAGEPLPGVAIKVKDTYHGVVTDIDGKAFIGVQPSEILQFIYLGYQYFELKVTYATNYKIILKAVPEEPEEPENPEASSFGYFYMY